MTRWAWIKSSNKWWCNFVYPRWTASWSELHCKIVCCAGRRRDWSYHHQRNHWYTRHIVSHILSLSFSSVFHSLLLSFLDTLPPVSGLSVTDSTENSVLLGWSPVTGATGYILRWTEEEGESFKSSGTDSVWFFKDQKQNYSWIHFLVYYVLSLFRHRNSSVWNAARNSHLLPCDWSTTGSSVPFHCATHLPKPGWTWDQRGGTNRLYSFFHTWL